MIFSWMSYVFQKPLGKNDYNITLESLCWKAFCQGDILSADVYPFQWFEKWFQCNWKYLLNCQDIKIGLFLIQISKCELNPLHMWNFNTLGTPFNFEIERIQKKKRFEEISSKRIITVIITKSPLLLSSPGGLWRGAISLTSSLMWRAFWELLGWPKSPYVFFHKTKDTFFIFTNNFIDLDILSMLAISRVV